MEHWHYNPGSGHIVLIGLAVGTALVLIFSWIEKAQAKRKRQQSNKLTGQALADWQAKFDAMEHDDPF